MQISSGFYIPLEGQLSLHGGRVDANGTASSSLSANLLVLSIVSSQPLELFLLQIAALVVYFGFRMFEQWRRKRPRQGRRNRQLEEANDK